MKFDFSKSREDLQNKFQLNKIDIINKNILYLTHEVDKCVVLLKKLENSANLQKQVDDYFEDPHGTGEAHLGSDPDHPED